jgi:hypothetical protein
VAIVQISRITNRKGLLDDLPQPLAGAELGWATNTRQLFIGNGTIAEGAPIVGNTEILTEFTDIFELKGGYTYKGLAGGYLVQTGPTADNPVSQPLQERLDSYVVATDFGIVGDGSTDNTAAINRALYQLYCRDTASAATRRGLFFPAGQYIITGTLLIPTWANLFGDSLGGSVITFETRVWSNLVAYDPGVTVEHEGAYYLALLAVPPGTGLGDLDYWQPTSAPLYIWRTADSDQNIDTAIGQDEGIPPSNISITDIVFETATEINAVLMQDVTNSTFTNMTVRGPLTKQTATDSAPDISAILWASTPIYPGSNNQFNGCTFQGFRFGTYDDQPIDSNTFRGCLFDTLYLGIYFSVADTNAGGASGTRIVENTFNNIFAQGILLQTVGLNVSAQNIFYDVGNQFNGIDNPSSAVIDFDADNNVSMGDMFARTDAIVKATNIPRINIHNRINITFESASRMNLGSYHRDSGITATLSDSQTDTTLFTVDTTQARAFAFDYTVTRGVGVRQGRVTVVASTDGNGTDLVYTDSGSENSDLGVTFGVSESLGTIYVLYTTTAIALDGQIYYSVVNLA